MFLDRVHRPALGGLLAVAVGIAPGCHQEPEATPELPASAPVPDAIKREGTRRAAPLPGDSATTPDPNPGAQP